MGIKRVRRLYTLLWRANEALDSAFSLILLVNLTYYFISVTAYFYFGTMYFVLSTPFIAGGQALIVVSLIMFSVILYSVLTTADTPAQQVTS